LFTERVWWDCRSGGKLTKVFAGKFVDCVVATVFALHRKVAFSNVAKADTFHLPGGTLWVPGRNQ
jgi:hypothetical protein